MKKFVDVDSSGKILQSYYAESAAEAMSSFVLKVEESVSLTQSYVDINTMRFIAKGLQPSENHLFDYEIKRWIESRSIESLKNIKNLYISISRLKANQSTFTFTSKQIAVDSLSRSDIDAVHGIVVLTNEMPEGWVGGWKAIDNTFVSIPNVSTWSLFYKAMVGQGSINFAHAQHLKAKLAAATTIEEVDAIVW